MWSDHWLLGIDKFWDFSMTQLDENDLDKRVNGPDGNWDQGKIGNILPNYFINILYAYKPPIVVLKMTWLHGFLQLMANS